MTRLVIGGSGSGKSDVAESLLEASPKKLYLATMLRTPDSEGRICRHTRRREGKGFVTIEKPRQLEELSIDPESGVLLEDLPNLLANEMFASDGSLLEGAYQRVAEEIGWLERSCASLVIVSDDIFSAGRCYGHTTLKYLEALGRLHAQIARDAEVIEVVAGIATWLLPQI